jgi:hypothetical protein
MYRRIWGPQDVQNGRFLRVGFGVFDLEDDTGGFGIVAIVVDDI